MKFINTRAFPSFYQDYAPKLIEFFGLWVDWLNEQGNSAYIIDHLSSERDIDASIDAYKTHIKNTILKDFPEDIATDLKLLLKNVFYLYNSKSSIKSYDFLFRSLFNSPASISYPKKYMLKASDGRWFVKQCMKTVGENLAHSISTYNYWLITGDKSGATAYINGTTDSLVQKRNVVSLGVMPSIVVSYADDRRFKVGQTIKIQETPVNISNISIVDGKTHITLSEINGETPFLKEKKVDNFSVYEYDVSRGDKIISTTKLIDGDDDILAVIIAVDKCEFTKVTLIDEHQTNITLDSINGVFVEGEHLTLTNPETGEVVNIPDLCVGYIEEVREEQESTNGQISSDMVIQDGLYYQDFSYTINSMVSIHKWRTLVKTLIHPAGLQMFAELNLSGDDSGDEVVAYALNAVEFLRAWKIMFQTCVFDVMAKILYQQWSIYRSSIAQRHSDTLDGWLHFYEKYQNDGIVEAPFDFDTKRGYCFTMIPPKDISKQKNINNILLFRDNGTMISPTITQWATYEFLAGVDTNNIHGIRLKSQSNILTGIINGSEWTTPEEDEVIEKNFMMFITNKSSNRNTRIRNMILENEYLKYDEKFENLYEYDVRHTTINDMTNKYPNEQIDWKSLTIDDYIATSIDEDVHYDAYSLLKVPDNHISLKDKTYTMEKYTYNDENLVVYSHSPEDFTHKIFIERLVDKIDVHYSKYKWCDINNPSEFPILNSNIKVYETEYENNSEYDYTTDLYRCESLNIVDDEEVQFQQTHYDVKLPYTIDKENVLLFVDGKYSNEYTINDDNILHIDSIPKNREISYYIQSGGYVSSDKLGKNIVYNISHRSFFVDVKNGNIAYYIRNNLYASTDFVGTNISYTVSPTKQVIDIKNGNSIGYLHTTGVITSSSEEPNDSSNKPILYRKENKFYYDKECRKLAYYQQSDGTLTKDEEGSEVYYRITNYTLVIPYNSNSLTDDSLYWQQNDTITKDADGNDVLYTAFSYDVIHDFQDVVYYIQDDNSISTDIYGRDIVFYRQADDTITSNNILFDTTILKFGDCEIDSIISISESETKEFGDFILNDLVVTELDDAKTTIFGDMRFEDIMYHIRGIKQDSVNTTIEVYLMSPIEAMRKQKTSYTNDRHFTYDSIINMPFAPSKHMLRWLRIVDMNDFFNIELGDRTRKLTWFNPFNTLTEMKQKNKVRIFEPVQIQSETMDNHFGRDYTYKGSVDTIDDLKNIINPKIGDLYNISLIADDKTYPVTTNIFDDASYVWTGNTWEEYIEKPMERLYNIHTDERNARYSMRSVDEILAAKNESSTLVFTDEGSLIYPELIDWHNKELVYDVESDYLHSLPLMSTKPYKKVFISNRTFNISEDYSMFFIDGKKIPQKHLIKTQNGWEISTNYSYEDSYVYAFNYHNDFIYDSYEGNTSTIVSVKDAVVQGVYSIQLNDVSGDIMVEFSDGNADRFANIRFYQMLKEETSNDVLYNLTSNSILTAKKSEYFIDKDYIVVFVDGLYNTNFEYKTNGTIVLYDTPKDSFEVFLLKPLAYNKPDVTRITDSYFTFDNLRIDNFASAGEVKIKYGKIFGGVSPTDLLFIKRLIKKLEIFEQSLDYKYHTKLNMVSAPNIMHHYTWDRLLMDGTQDVFITQSYLYTDDLAEAKTAQLQEISPYDTVNYSKVITRETVDDNGVISIIEESTFDRKKLGELSKDNSLYVIPDIINPLVQTEVSTTNVEFNDYLSTHRLAYDTGSETTTFGTQTANSMLKNDRISVGKLSSEYDITVYSEENKVISDFGNITADTIIDADKLMIIEDSLMDDFTTVSSYESKFNRYATMLFDNQGSLINPMLIDWPVTSFHLKHNMNAFSSVCLNGKQPAIIGLLEKREFNTKLIGESSQLDVIALDKENNSSQVQTLEMSDTILQSDMLTILKTLGDVGIKNYFYYKIEGDLLEALYAKDDEFIPENIFLFLNGKKVFKNDFSINVDERCYILDNFERYYAKRFVPVDLGTLTEQDIIMGVNNSYSKIGNMIDDDKVYSLNEDLILEDIETLSEVDNVIQIQENAKEAIVFEYNPDDFDAVIELFNPVTNRFELPNIGYTKDEILVFKNGYKTTDYYIAGDTLVLNAENKLGYLSTNSVVNKDEDLLGEKSLDYIMSSFDNNNLITDEMGYYNTNTSIPFAETVEIYVFKKLDYLMVDESKYNNNYKNFIVKNLKRSTYF